eukprot:Platyproteum_vivax@DN2199_c0_g1_i2.p1
MALALTKPEKLAPSQSGWHTVSDESPPSFAPLPPAHERSGNSPSLRAASVFAVINQTTANCIRTLVQSPAVRPATRRLSAPAAQLASPIRVVEETGEETRGQARPRSSLLGRRSLPLVLKPSRLPSLLKKRHSLTVMDDDLYMLGNNNKSWTRFYTVCEPAQALKHFKEAVISLGGTFCRCKWPPLV